MGRKNSDRGGRPSKLKDPARKTILNLVHSGSPFSDTAKAVGLAPGTVGSWRRQGRKYFKAGKPTKYLTFHVAFEKARADFVSDTLDLIATAAKGTATRAGQWQASAWLLERRRPEEFALSRDLIRDLLARTTQLDQLVRQLVQGRRANEPQRDRRQCGGRSSEDPQNGIAERVCTSAFVRAKEKAAARPAP